MRQRHTNSFATSERANESSSQENEQSYRKRSKTLETGNKTVDSRERGGVNVV